MAKAIISLNALSELNRRFNVIQLGQIGRVCREAMRQRFKRGNITPIHHDNTLKIRYYDDYLRDNAALSVHQLSEALTLNPITIRKRMGELGLVAVDGRRRRRSKLPPKYVLLKERSRKKSVAQMAKKYRVSAITLYKHLYNRERRPRVSDESIITLAHLPPQTIATELNISLNTVKRRLAKLVRQSE